MKNRLLTIMLCCTMMLISISASATDGMWFCTVADNDNNDAPNVGRCFEREDGAGYECLSGTAWQMFNTKCNGNIYNIVITPE